MWLALAVWVLDVAFFSTAGSNLGQVGPGNLSPLGLIAFAGLGAAALTWRKRAPLLVFGIVWLHAMIGTTLVSGYQPVLCLLVMVYTVGAHCPRERAWVIAPAVLPSAVVAVNEAWLSTPDKRMPVFLGLLGFFTLVTAGVWTLGHWTAVSRRRLAESQRLRKVEAELAVARERARISRELHDIVAHTVTMMVLQAAGAQRILHGDPARAEQSLGQIAELGRTAMNELRRMLTLTQPSVSPPSEPSVSQAFAPSVSQAFAPSVSQAFAPSVSQAFGPSVSQAFAPPVSEAEPSVSPGLDDLGDLLERVRGSGITVGFSQEGTPRHIDASVALAAYRTVQEALTNAAKHAGPEAAAQVRLVWSDDLLVEVVDAGVPGLSAKQPPASSTELSTGHGLLGLRERVTIAGGHLDAASRDGGGFRVAAVLPVARE